MRSTRQTRPKLLLLALLVAWALSPVCALAQEKTDGTSDLDKLKASLCQKLQSDGKADEYMLFEWRAKAHFLAYLDRVAESASTAQKYLSKYSELLQANQG